MGTWISHLRIAENMLEHLSGLDEVMFTYGSLAPDSGLPNKDWSEFNPPKSISHYIPQGGSESGTRDLLFYREYLSGNLSKNPLQYSFMLGYFIHLVCDHLASEKFGQSTQVYYAELFQKVPISDAWEIIKTDWYGLDQRFVRDNSTSLFWRVFLPAPIPQSPIPFLPQSAFVHQMNYIKNFYSKPDPAWILERSFPYMNEMTQSRFVQDASSAILKILNLIDDGGLKVGMYSAVEMLAPEERAAYPPPLGDVVD